LTLTEREEISRGIAAGDSLRTIAMRLGGYHRRSVERSAAARVITLIEPLMPMIVLNDAGPDRNG